jgi:hypothetical protein
MLIIKVAMLVTGLFLGYKMDRDFSNFRTQRKVKIVADRKK